jgi:regulatory protein
MQATDRSKSDEIYFQAKEQALRRLEKKEYSSREIYRYLKGKKHPDEVIERVVSELLRLDLISDERFTRMMVRYQAGRGKGSRYILQKLKEKGISVPLEQVEAIRSEVADSNELDTAKQVLERKYPDAWEDRSKSNRAFQGLIRRGFSFETAKAALNWLKTRE